MRNLGSCSSYPASACCHRLIPCSQSQLQHSRSPRRSCARRRAEGQFDPHIAAVAACTRMVTPHFCIALARLSCLRTVSRRMIWALKVKLQSQRA